MNTISEEVPVEHNAPIDTGKQITTPEEDTVQHSIHLLDCLDECSCVWTKEAVIRAASKDDLEVFLWFVDKGVPYDDCDVAAAGSGGLRILRWYHCNKKKVSPRACIEATLKGHISTLEWLSQYYLGDLSLTSFAIKGNQVETLKWLLDRNFYCSSSLVVEEAVVYNRIEIVEWLITDGFTCDPTTTSLASFEMLKKLRELQCPWDGEVLINAALSKNKEMLVWAIENGCEWGEYTINGIACKGDVEAAVIALDHGCLLDCVASSFAAEEGHFEMLKWLHEKGAPFTEDTFSCASYHGNLEILEWLKKINCPMDSTVYSCAIKEGNIHTLDWLNDNDAPRCERTFSVAVSKGLVDNLQWLHSRNFPSKGVYSTENEMVAKWLIDRGYEVKK